MTIECTDKIPLTRFKQWHDILCATGGRYLRNPFLNDDTVYVCYRAGDYSKQWELYARVTTPIVEIRKDQRWRVILRRIGISV